MTALGVYKLLARMGGYKDVLVMCPSKDMLQRAQTDRPVLRVVGVEENEDTVVVMTELDMPPEKP